MGISFLNTHICDPALMFCAALMVQTTSTVTLAGSRTDKIVCAFLTFSLLPKHLTDLIFFNLSNHCCIFRHHLHSVLATAIIYWTLQSRHPLYVLPENESTDSLRNRANFRITYFKSQ
jgi:hypothetical protein